MAVRREGPGLVKQKKTRRREEEERTMREREKRNRWISVWSRKERISKGKSVGIVLLKGALTHNTWTLRKIYSEARVEPKINPTTITTA